MYGTCETLCRELNAQYPADTPLMLVVWSPADIEALAEGMEYSVTDHEIRTVLARMDELPEEERLESGVSANAVMTLITQVKNAAQSVPVPAELLESLIITAEQALWKREWGAKDAGITVPECVTRRMEVIRQVRTLLRDNTSKQD